MSEEKKTSLWETKRFLNVLAYEDTDEVPLDDYFHVLGWTEKDDEKNTPEQWEKLAIHNMANVYKYHIQNVSNKNRKIEKYLIWMKEKIRNLWPEWMKEGNPYIKRKMEAFDPLLDQIKKHLNSTMVMDSNWDQQLLNLLYEWMKLFSPSDLQTIGI